MVLGGGVFARQVAIDDASASATVVLLERHEYRQIHMGVEARLVLFAADEARAGEAAQAAFDELAALDAILSDYRVDSELTRLMLAAGQRPIPVSDELFEVLSAARELGELSRGAFDVTAAPLISAWREARRVGHPPDAETIAAARAAQGLDALQLMTPSDRSEPPRAGLARAGMRLDLGGLAKGYAVDRALDVVRAQGVTSALVELGGDLAVSAAPPGQGAWLIEVGCGQGALPPTRLALTNTAVSTSGDTEQHFVHEGVRYSHVIDPRSGQAKHDALCVTVLSRRGIHADALASAVRVLGVASGAELLERAATALGETPRLLVDGAPLLKLSSKRTPGLWRDLLGEDLSNWEMVAGEDSLSALPEEWLRDGVLAIPSTPPSGWIRTKSDHRDFHLRLDVKLARMANGGIFLRSARDGGNPSYTGCEVQLLDDFHWEAETNSVLRDWQFTGSLYGAVAPADRAAFGPIGTWNSFELLFEGTRLAVMLNGRLLYDVDTTALEVEPPFAARAATGAIGLQRYAAPSVEGDVAVWARNVFLREL